MSWFLPCVSFVAVVAAIWFVVWLIAYIHDRRKEKEVEECIARAKEELGKDVSFIFLSDWKK